MSPRLIGAVSLLLLALGGCEMRELTSEQLWGKPDAAAPAPAPAGDADVTPPPPPDGPPPGGGITVILSGVVRNKCTGEAIDALVGIAGKHTCSFTLKGSYFFRLEDLPANVRLTISAQKKGFAHFTDVLLVTPGGNTYNIDLVPDTGTCASNPRPESEECVCTAPNCVKS